MLVLTRRLNETIMIGDKIEITITKLSKNQATISCKAPKEIKIMRKEIANTPKKFTE
jgi:carbon storage regulator